MARSVMRDWKGIAKACMIQGMSYRLIETAEWINVAVPITSFVVTIEQPLLQIQIYNSEIILN